jgi:hypothetical protein
MYEVFPPLFIWSGLTLLVHLVVGPFPAAVFLVMVGVMIAVSHEVNHV